MLHNKKKHNNLISLFLLTILAIACFRVTASEQSEFQQVIINDAFIEFHTGPGRGFPVFHIEEKGEKIFLIKKKTQWFKVKAVNGKMGWVHQDKLENTLTLQGDEYQSDKTEQDDFVNRKFETGVIAGEFGGAQVMTLFSGFNWTKNITSELAISQAIGSASDIQFINFNMMHQPFPEWRVSPYIKIGGGIIKTKPSATLVLTEDREDEMVHAGLGVRFYISQQFFIRAEYNSHTILTSRNDNDEIEEWKLGFSVFF